MKSQNETVESELVKPPFVYEIKVKGRLSGEQWTSWFGDLALSFRKGESALRGEAADHAALYGLLARLRDLAVPLVSVRVLDAEAQRRLAQQRRRFDLAINLLLAAVYLALLGALATVTIFAAQVVNTALALGLFFAALGGLAHAFWLWSGQVAWRWLTYVAWPAAVISLVVYIPLSGLLPAPLGIGILLLIIAGGLVYGISYLRQRRGDINGLLPGARTADGRFGRNGAEFKAAQDPAATWRRR